MPHVQLYTMVQDSWRLSTEIDGSGNHEGSYKPIILQVMINLFCYATRSSQTQIVCRKAKAIAP